MFNEKMSLFMKKSGENGKLSKTKVHKENRNKYFTNKVVITGEILMKKKQC